MGTLPAVPQPTNVNGVLRFEISEFDLVQLSTDELRAFEELIFAAARRQADRGVRLTLTSWHDYPRNVYCMAFSRADPDLDPLRA